MSTNLDIPEPSPPPGAGVASIVYRVDAHDRIVWIGPGWMPFAEANDAPALTIDAVLEHPLRDWITNPAVWNLYGLLMHRVRRTGEPVTFPFRCDAPALRRFLTMTLTPMPSGGLRFDSRLVRTEPRDPVVLFDRRHPRSERFVTVCSWCKRVKTTRERWLEVEAAVAELELFGVERLPELTHGICADCASQLMAFAEP